MSFSSQDSRSDSRGSTRTEEDWDQIEPAIDLDGAARGSATVKGRNEGRASSSFLSERLPLSHAPTTCACAYTDGTDAATDDTTACSAAADGAVGDGGFPAVIERARGV